MLCLRKKELRKKRIGEKVTYGGGGIDK